MSTVSRAADLYGLSCRAWTRPSWIKSTFQECRGCRSYIVSPVSLKKTETKFGKCKTGFEDSPHGNLPCLHIFPLLSLRYLWIQGGPCRIVVKMKVLSVHTRPNTPSSTYFESRRSHESHTVKER